VDFIEHGFGVFASWIPCRRAGLRRYNTWHV